MEEQNIKKIKCETCGRLYDIKETENTVGGDNGECLMCVLAREEDRENWNDFMGSD